jgi:hypothetical protein
LNVDVPECAKEHVIAHDSDDAAEEFGTVPQFNLLDGGGVGKHT